MSDHTLVRTVILKFKGDNIRNPVAQRIMVISVVDERGRVVDAWEKHIPLSKRRGTSQ